MALQAIGLFCDDVREEKSGQITLVGILPDNINVPAPPQNALTGVQGIIPRLGLYIRINVGLNENPGPINIKLVLPNEIELSAGTIGSEIIETSKKQAIENNLPFAGILHHAVVQGFAVPGRGKMLAVLEVQGERQTCAVLNFIYATES